ncbi:hypothetical protein H6B10_17175, partial [Gemmiger formicilis]|nr:hypothetical protein [Gemmiger formicilis]
MSCGDQAGKFAAVQDACAGSGQPVPQTVGQLMQCVYRSLTLCYKNAIA